MATRLDAPPFATRPQQPSLGSLIGDLAHKTTTLLRREVELAKAEMSEKIERLQTAVASMAAGAAVLYAGFLVFLFFVVAALDAVLDRWIETNWLAPLIVSVIVLAVGYTMLKAGQKKMKEDTLVPERTLRSLQRDASFMQRETEVARAEMQAGAVRSRPVAEEVR